MLRQRPFIAFNSVLTLLLVSACTSAGLPGLRPLTYSTGAEERVVALGTACPHAPKGKESATLLATLGVAAATKLLSNVQTLFDNASKGGALPASVATENLELEPGSVPQCLIALRGEFDKTKDSKSPVEIAQEVGDGNRDIEDSIKSSSLPTVYSLDHYAEFQLVVSANQKAMSFAPTYVWIRRSVDGSTSGVRSLSAEIKFDGSLDASSAKAADGGVVLLANRKLGAKTPFERAGGRYPHEAAWFPGFNPVKSDSTSSSGTTTAGTPPASNPKPSGQTPPTAPPQPTTSGRFVGGAGAGGSSSGSIGAPPAGPVDQSAVDLQSRTKTALPFTVTLTWVETRPEDARWALIATAISTASPTVQNGLTSLADPTIDANARATKLTTDDAVTVAKASADASILAYCKSSAMTDDPAARADRVTKSTAAHSAQIAVNAAAIKALLPEPYRAADIVVISSAMDGPSQAACKALQ